MSLDPKQIAADIRRAACWLELSRSEPSGGRCDRLEAFADALEQAIPGEARLSAEYGGALLDNVQVLVLVIPAPTEVTS